MQITKAQENNSLKHKLTINPNDFILELMGVNARSINDLLKFSRLSTKK